MKAVYWYSILPILKAQSVSLQLENEDLNAKFLQSIKADSDYLKSSNSQTCSQNPFQCFFKLSGTSCDTAVKDFNSDNWTKAFPWEYTTPCNVASLILFNLNFEKISGVTFNYVINILSLLRKNNIGNSELLATTKLTEAFDRNQWAKLSNTIKETFSDRGFDEDSITKQADEFTDIYKVARIFCELDDENNLSQLTDFDWITYTDDSRQLYDRVDKCTQPRSYTDEIVSNSDYYFCKSSLGDTKTCTDKKVGFCDLSKNIRFSNVSGCLGTTIIPAVDNSWKLIVGLCVGIGVPFLILVAVLIYCFQRRRRMPAGLKRVSVYRKEIRKENKENPTWSLSKIDQKHMATKKDFKLIMDDKHRLGSGEFADVYICDLRMPNGNRKVAAKYVKDPSRRHIVPEILIGYQLRDHKNILSVLKIYWPDKGENLQPLIFYPLMEAGDVEKFVKKHCDSKTLKLCHCFDFMLQLSRGLAFMHSPKHRVYHGDLAIRNLMLKPTTDSNSLSGFELKIIGNLSNNIL